MSKTVRVVLPALESPRSALAVDSYGPLIARWSARRLGIELGPWQQYALGRMLEHDAQGDLLARLALMSVARQNGKSVIVRALVGWMLDEGYKIPALAEWIYILLAAHDAGQARIVYEKIRRDTTVLHNVHRWGHGARRLGKDFQRATQYTGIEINGVAVDTATSQAGSKRGISAGLICFDEVLTQRSFATYEVLSPAQVAIKNSLMLMTSTAGFADSVVLRSQYDRLYRQSTGAEQHDPSFVGMWWRADEDDIAIDWEQLEKANPALDDGRLQRSMIQNEYNVLPRGSWVRERLNRWMDERVDAPFGLKAWGDCRLANPLDPDKVDGGYVIGVDVTAGWAEGAVVVAAQRKDDRVGVELDRHLRGTRTVSLTADDFIQRIKQITSRVKVDQIVYSGSSPLAPSMERHKVQSGLPYVAITAEKMMQSCDDFAEAVISKRVAHDDPYLDSQITVAQRRFVGTDGRWRWAISQNPINGVVAVTMATMAASRATSGMQLFM